MFHDDTASDIHRLITEHVSSPSLRHIRDRTAIKTLVRRILETDHRPPGLWSKWLPLRETLIKAVAWTWIPADDLRDALNQYPGPALTLTDVTQRLNAIHEEEEHWPVEAFRADCLALYRREREAGTELIAIAGLLRDFVEEATRQAHERRKQEWAEQRVAEKQALEDRFLAGADCGRTTLKGSTDLFIRKNGRAYRLARTKDRRWEMFRITGFGDAGVRVGIYGTRGDASKSLAQLAYVPEPRW